MNKNPVDWLRALREGIESVKRFEKEVGKERSKEYWKMYNTHDSLKRLDKALAAYYMFGLVEDIPSYLANDKWGLIAWSGYRSRLEAEKVLHEHKTAHGKYDIEAAVRILSDRLKEYARPLSK